MRKLSKFLAIATALAVVLGNPSLAVKADSAGTVTEDRPTGDVEFRVEQIGSSDFSDLDLWDAEVAYETAGVSISGTEQAYWSQYTSDYYYNKLSAAERSLWDELDEMCLYYISTTEDLTYGMTDYVSFSLNEISLDRASDLALLFVNENPQYYFLNSGCSYGYGGSEGAIAIWTYDEYSDGSARGAVTKAFRNQLDTWMSDVYSVGTDPLAREREAHDLVCDEIDYNYDGIYDMYNQSAASAVIDRLTVCTGYMKTFQMLSNAAGINTISVTSEDHAWNQVYLNGNWFFVDTCWDDGGNGYIIYTYYNQNYTTINDADHTAEACYSSILPACSTSTAYQVSTNRLSAPAVTANANTISISAQTDYGTSFYTTDGSNPTSYRNNIGTRATATGTTKAYGGSFSVGSGTTVKAYNAASDWYDWDASRVVTLTVTEQDTSKLQAIYRLYCPVNGEHLYTTDYNEVQVLSTQHGWTYEGIGWYAPTSGTAVYRLYNPILRNHLYTTDTNEVNVLTSQYGWVKDNDGKPLFYSGGSTPIYRVYNAGLSGMHHMTTDYNEYLTLPLYDWEQEGIKLYAVK